MRRSEEKISLLGLILILVLSFTGCGKSETTEYDQATLEQYAEFVVQNFEAMTTEQLDSFSDMRDLQLDTQLMNAGLPVDGEDFLTMISSWEAAEEECGAYVEHGDWTMEVKNDGVSLTSEAKYENRDADIVFSFDEKGNMESMDVSAHYSTGEILESRSEYGTWYGNCIRCIDFHFIHYLSAWIHSETSGEVGK